MAEDSWTRDQKLVMHELKRLNDISEKMDGKIDAMSTKLARLEVKSSLWGAISGAVTSAVAIGIALLKNTLSKG